MPVTGVVDDTEAQLPLMPSTVAPTVVDGAVLFWVRNSMQPVHNRAASPATTKRLFLIRAHVSWDGYRPNEGRPSVPIALL